MWVLDAWYKAEKVWYPVVWEKIKDADNVVDYDIREEITVETSSVSNANNDTTTGMATVIPWINAPKIVAETSIVSASNTKSGSATMSWTSAYWHVDTAEPDYTATIKNFTITDETWELQYIQDAKWIVVPKTAAYAVTMTYSRSWASRDEITRFVQDWETLHSYTPPDYSIHTGTFYVFLTKWKHIYVEVDIRYIGSSSLSWTSTVSFTIQSIT